MFHFANFIKITHYEESIYLSIYLSICLVSINKSFAQLNCSIQEAGVLHECNFTDECVNILCFDDCNNLTVKDDYQSEVPFHFDGVGYCESPDVVEVSPGNNAIGLLSSTVVNGVLQGETFIARLNNTPFDNCKLTLKFDTKESIWGLGSPPPVPSGPRIVEVWGSSVLPCRWDDRSVPYACDGVNIYCANGDNYRPVCLGSAVVTATNTTHTIPILTASLPIELNYLIFVFKENPTCVELDNFSLIPDCAVETGFTYNDDICNEIIFTPNASGTRLSHSWDFGDGGTSTLDNPTHSFASNGTYNVTHTVVDNCGNSHAETMTVRVLCCAEPGTEAIVIDGTVSPINLSTLIGSVLPTGSLSSSDIYLRGNLNIDVSYSFNACHWICEPASEIRIQSQAFTNFVSCNFISCEKMWKGIVVKSGGYLVFRSCTESDAQYGISLENNSGLSCTDNIFDRCFVGIYSSGFGSLKTITNYIDGNTFSCTGLLKPPYSGQSYYPSSFAYPGIPPRITFAGLWMNDVSSGNYGLLFRSGNTFTGIRNGIIARGGGFSAVNNSFTNLKGNNNNGGIYDLSGIGIDNSYTLNTVIYNNKAKNVYRGLRNSYSTNATINITNNNIQTDPAIWGVAIESGWGNNNLFDINDNRLKSNNGIRLYGSSLSQAAIMRNSIDNDGYLYSVQLDGDAIYFSNLTPTVDIAVTGNAVSILNHYFNGFYAQNSSGIRFEDNEMFSNHKEFGAFAYMGNCSYSDFNTNRFASSMATLANNGHGFYISQSSGISLCCNTIDRTELGITAYGSCPSTSLKSNIVNDCAGISIWLYEGVIGLQDHEGNLWLGNNTQGNITTMFSNPGAIAAGSQFKVNLSQNANFEPDWVPPIVAGIWFVNDPLILDTLCGEKRCSANKKYRDDGLEVRNCQEANSPYIDIANGIALESVYEDQYRWSSQLYLYGLLSRDGLPGWQECPELVEFYQNPPDHIAAYYSVENKLRELKYNPEYLAGQVAERQENIVSINSAIHDLYAQYPDTSGIYPYQNQVTELTSALTTEMENLGQLNNELLDVIDERASVIMEEAMVLEESLGFHNENKTIYYYLSKLVKDGPESLPDDAWQEIRTIAHLCPLAYGSPVQQARGMLMDYLGESVSTSDEELCGGEMQHRKAREMITTERPSLLSLFPNPTTGSWQIRFGKGDSGSYSLIVRDKLGMVCISKIIQAGDPHAVMDMTRYPAGIYFVEIIGADNQSCHEKLILVR